MARDRVCINQMAREGVAEDEAALEAVHEGSGISICKGQMEDLASTRDAGRGKRWGKK